MASCYSVTESSDGGLHCYSGGSKVSSPSRAVLMHTVDSGVSCVMSATAMTATHILACH